MTTVRCPMPECRRRIDLDAVPATPDQPPVPPCLHYIAAWGPRIGGMAEAVLFGLDQNRELHIRNLRPAAVRPERIEEVRADLEAAARQHAREVVAGEEEGGSAEPSAGAGRADAAGALFGDQHERDRVAFFYAQIIIGPDPTLPPAAR
jgi:hypothetical protein